MLELLREHELASEFRKAFRETSEAMVAVPFWGRGAIRSLGLQNGSNVRIICNLDHPGCNPDVIEELYALKIKVKTHRQLHAKIYVTPTAAIVGSSNVSTNGLTVEGSGAAGWIEANALSDDPSFVTKVRGLFETLWKSDDARTVRLPDIRAAQKQRAKLAPTLFEVPGGASLFEAVCKQPKLFSKVYVAAYTEGLGKEGKRVLRKVKSGAVAPRKGLDESNFKHAWGYQFEDVNEGDWLVDLDCRNPKKMPKVSGSAQATGLKLPAAGADGPETDLVIAIPRPINIGGREFRLRPEEKASLIRSAKGILREADGELLPINKAIEMIGWRSQAKRG